MSRVLITGASGFVGRHLGATLLQHGAAVRAAVRSPSSLDRLPAGVEPRLIGEIGPHTTWTPDLFDDVETVVHLAARVHVLRERAADPEAEFRQTNVQGTERLARAAAGRVRRLVFVSSLHAMRSLSDQVLDERCPCRPDTPYGRSKWEAEQRLEAVSRETGLEIVVLRPAPVYGPGGAGNLLSLLRCVRRGWPLPLAGVANHRSLLYVGNLVDALLTCLNAPQAAGRMFLVSDGETVSTAELVRRAAAAFGRSARVWPAPLGLLHLAGWLTGTRRTVDRLLGSLAVDISLIRQTLPWTPAYTLDQGLRETALWLGVPA
jgi:nucleoside-diphosphate-sugar epimerase